MRNITIISVHLAPCVQRAASLKNPRTHGHLKVISPKRQPTGGVPDVVLIFPAVRDYSYFHIDSLLFYFPATRSGNTCSTRWHPGALHEKRGIWEEVPVHLYLVHEDGYKMLALQLEGGAWRLPLVLQLLEAATLSRWRS